MREATLEPKPACDAGMAAQKAIETAAKSFFIVPPRPSGASEAARHAHPNPHAAPFGAVESRPCLRPASPRPATPSSIIAQVEGSGTAVDA
jgi:hypothetical protein